MKNYIFLFLKCWLLIGCLFIQHVAVAQETKNDSLETADTIIDDSKLPEEAVNSGQRTVLVEFVVEKDGSITNVQVVKGINPVLDEEAVRVVKNMTPPKNDKKVRRKFLLPISFNLHKD
jgi:TonB family protein